MFNRQPTLTDGTFTLRPLTRADQPPLRAAASDPLIWAGHPATDRHKPEIFDALFKSLLEFGGAMLVLHGDDVRCARIGEGRPIWR